MKLGQYTLSPIETGRVGLDGGAMFGVVPKMLWSKTNPSDDNNRITLAMRALLIQGDGKNILIDTGMGDHYDEKMKAIYNLDHSKYRMETSLAEKGLKPEDITHVIQTHLHFDHCGGLVRKDQNGKLIPFFPNAKVLIQKDQLAWARNPSDKDRVSFIKEDWEPVAAEGLVEEIDGPGELFPGIELMVFQGHTPSQMLPHIHADGKHILYCADLLPTKAHVPYPYIMGFDNHPMTTLEEKKQLLPRLYEEKWHLFFEHDPETALTTIEATEKGFMAGETVAL